MKKQINQAITLAKTGDNQEQLLKILRQLRTQITTPETPADTSHASIWPAADEDDQKGGWTIDPVFLQSIADSINIKTQLGPVLRFGLDFIECILIKAEKHHAITPQPTKLILAEKEFDALDLINRVLKNINRPPKGTHFMHRWAIVRDMFGVGSTVACALCRQFELNPDDVIR